MAIKENKKIIITDYNNNIVYDNLEYEDYSFDSNYASVADAFNMTLIDSDIEIYPGYGLQFYINNQIAFRGIIQRKDTLISKDRRNVRLSGMDRATILLESFCNNFKDFNNEKPTTIIDNLINQTSFYTKQKGIIEVNEAIADFNSADDIANRNKIILDDVNNNSTLSQINDETIYDFDFKNLSNKKHFKIDVGEQVFDKIYDLVTSYGFEILYQENGELYIGDLSKKRYNDKIKYQIFLKRNGDNNNIITANLVDDISGRYSTVQVSSQSEGYQYENDFPYVNKTAIATDLTMPIKKFYAINSNSTDGSPEKIAIQMREDMRLGGFVLNYDVPGHIAENGDMWRVNRYVNVYDELLNIKENLVLYGRTFIFDVNNGTHTILKIGRERSQDINYGN